MTNDSTRCDHCQRVVRLDDIVVIRQDEDVLATLEDDEPLEWFCPHCLEPGSPTNWTNIDKRVMPETLF